MYCFTGANIEYWTVSKAQNSERQVRICPTQPSMTYTLNYFFSSESLRPPVCTLSQYPAYTNPAEEFTMKKPREYIQDLYSFL